LGPRLKFPNTIYNSVKTKTRTVLSRQKLRQFVGKFDASNFISSDTTQTISAKKKEEQP
jgi:hypothetical protein